ncbi:MAG: pilus assembly protein PilZ [Spirochaetaceae bacterium]|jgi:hypothetical protein|nr:pilus assembly protein PilZ [Spirochaetaceae bacterium]
MGVLPSQKVAALYEQFKTIDLSFNKAIIEVTGIIMQQISIKCGGDSFPCVIYSSSFQGARIATTAKILPRLQENNNAVNLKFCFKKPDANPLTFFVSARSIGYAPYGNQNDMSIFNLQFTQQPPDDLIEIIGRVLETTANASARSNEHITITENTQRRLNLSSKDISVFIQGVPRRCILRALSFSSAKIVMMGISKFLVKKEVVLKVEFMEPTEGFLIKGIFSSAEAVNGRKDLLALTVQFDEAEIPFAYKMRINDYITMNRAGDRTEQANPVVQKSSFNAQQSPSTAQITASQG